MVDHLRFDVNRFQALLIDLPESQTPVSTFTFGGVSKADAWSPLPVYSDRPRLEEPDIWHLVGCAVLVMSKATVEALEPFVSMAGELLPVISSETSDELYALNILEDVACLDPTAYDLDALTLYPRFIEHRLPETGLFKVPQIDTVDIFCVERSDDHDSFRSRVEARGLGGVTFKRVWSSSQGAADVNLMLPPFDW